MRHVNPQVLGLLFCVGTPNFTQQLLVGNDFANVLRKNFQQRILGGCELNFLSLQSDCMAGKINGEMSGVKKWLVGR